MNYLISKMKEELRELLIKRRVNEAVVNRMTDQKVS